MLSFKYVIWCSFVSTEKDIFVIQTAITIIMIIHEEYLKTVTLCCCMRVVQTQI